MKSPDVKFLYAAVLQLC